MQPIKATNIRWRVLFITLFLGYIAYVFRGNLSVIGKYLMDDYGVTQIELGWLLSSFLWGYTLFQFPGGLLSEKIGPKSTLIVCTVGCTLITIISGFIVLGGFSIALMIPLLFLSFSIRRLSRSSVSGHCRRCYSKMVSFWFLGITQWNDFNGVGTWFCLNAPNNCLSS